MNHPINQSLIDSLAKCAAACNHCISACLGQKDVNRLKNCINVNIDCAELCGLTAGFMTRNSAHAGHLILECVETCNQCASECEKNSHLLHCKECAVVCRECAIECIKEQNKMSNDSRFLFAKANYHASYQSV
jgi:hypothetical protein